MLTATIKQNTTKNGVAQTVARGAQGAAKSVAATENS